MNWEIKCSWGSGCIVSPLNGSVKDHGGKAPEKIKIFSLKLVLYSLLKIIKLKLKLSVVNKKLLL